ncbi:MAG: type I restriction endonuclease subunit R [bacterium]|nr:type I restriction endonuclease subunit R [bacterium]
MSPHHPDTEAALEAAAVERFVALGYATANLYHETFGPGNSHGRETSAEVVFRPRLRAALRKLNPLVPPEQLDAAIEANQELHGVLKNGMPATWKDKNSNDCTDRIRCVDWDTPLNNEFFLAQQMWVTGDIYKKRCDLIVFVNGVQSRMGSITAHWEHFCEWKKISDENEQGVISLDTMIQGTCAPARLLELIENYIVYAEMKGGLAKVVPMNHQYLGVRNAVDAVRQMGENKGRLGVFWHTQGSGKSYSMVFFCQYIMRRVPGNWTFVVITDRNELDDQIYKTFANAGMVREQRCQAESGEHLQRLLSEDHCFVFTLIQKFQMRDGNQYPVLSKRSDIIVITDEAHRSQYDTLAMNMRRALPNAAFIGFTGTPLMVGEEKTRQVFGAYVSIYNFKQSVDDGATVPLYYENRIPELQLTNEQLNEDMTALLESAELDEEQEKKLERTFAKEYHLITRDERLETIAKDLVEHYMGRGVLGKAIVVCVDRFTAVRMHDKVNRHWQLRRNELRRRAAAGESGLAEQVRYMDESDMAVIVSASQNEQAMFQEKGLDILTHRTRMAKEDLETSFKDENDPLRLVFVCAMWLTGFDVPCCSTMYLDKPMKNHTLMQSIARANRVFPEKHNGLIVDYIGIFRNLQKALSVYGSDAGGGITPGDTPVHDKRELVGMLKTVAAELTAFCEERAVSLAAIATEPRTFERTALIEDAVERLVYPEEDKKEFLRKAGLVVRMHKAVMPDVVAHEFDVYRRVIEAIAANLRPAPEDVDISAVMREVEELLDRSIAAKGYVIRDKSGETGGYGKGLVDLSQIDVKRLKAIFDQGHQRTMLERLRQAIERRLQKMVGLNQSRLDYLEKFKEMIDEYNRGSKNIEQFFKELTTFMAELDAEEQRGMREGLTEEELAVFDILTKPEMKMTEKERAAVKKVAQALLTRLKAEKLVLDWRKRQQARAAVRLTIETTLDECRQVRQSLPAHL